MQINDKLIGSAERISLLLRELYYSCGYRAYRMNKFEEYDLYSKNKEFLVSDNVITFTDADGKLMALKPDVTLSIIKNSASTEKEIKKVFYSENVYRTASMDRTFKEIMQTGLECFGELTEKETIEVLLLAAKSLKTISRDCVLDISDISILNKMISDLGVSESLANDIIKLLGEKNFDGIARIAENADEEKFSKFLDLVKINGKIKDVLPKLRAIGATVNDASFSEFLSALSVISENENADLFRVDFSVVGDLNYYNGIVFKGFIKNLPKPALSGGQYDNLMKKLAKSGKAIGFAVYLDVLERLTNENTTDENGDEYINVALPKGRLGEKVYGIFAAAGYECPSVLNPNRKLVFTNEEKKIRYFWVKPSDVTIYVERGAADVGVAGKDIILEYRPDVYELLDLKEGKCRMAVATVNGFTDDESKTLRVATKFSNIARDFYMRKGRDIDVIHLNGSIEIAPILGLADVIVDIVETGATLKENDLSVIETVCPISARLIANKSASKFKAKILNEMLQKLKNAVETNDDQNL